MPGRAGDAVRKARIWASFIGWYGTVLSVRQVGRVIARGVTAVTAVTAGATPALLFASFLPLVGHG
jgi:hypothetical protein